MGSTERVGDATSSATANQRYDSISSALKVAVELDLGGRRTNDFASDWSILCSSSKASALAALNKPSMLSVALMQSTATGLSVLSRMPKFDSQRLSGNFVSLHFNGMNYLAIHRSNKSLHTSKSEPTPQSYDCIDTLKEI